MGELEVGVGDGVAGRVADADGFGVAVGLEAVDGAAGVFVAGARDSAADVGSAAEVGAVAARWRFGGFAR